MAVKGKPRGPVFSLDTDVFLELWKNNQVKFQKDNADALKYVGDLRAKNEGAFKSLADEDLQQNYRSLCLNVFDRAIQKDGGNPKATMEQVAATDGGKHLAEYLAASSKKAKDDASYLFIKARVMAKAKNLFDDMKDHNDKILMPIGHSKRNLGITQGPKGRDWAEEAKRWG